VTAIPNRGSRPCFPGFENGYAGLSTRTPEDVVGCRDAGQPGADDGDVALGGNGVGEAERVQCVWSSALERDCVIGNGEGALSIGSGIRHDDTVVYGGKIPLDTTKYWDHKAMRGCERD
jgi:hypothetical protein